MWEQESTFDNGNGAIIITSRCADYPAVIKKAIDSYTGRQKNSVWYEVDGDPARREFGTAKAAQDHAAKLGAIPTQTLREELRRRRQ